MILGNGIIKSKDGAPIVTLDALFREAAAKNPDVVALIDPPNRESFADGAPRRLTYAQCDRAISALTARLQQIGLTPDCVIGVQLPNTIENILTLLAILRAGMIATPLPLLWRRADCITALSRVGAKALIGCGRVGDTDHGLLAMEVAAEVFTIRHVCVFGALVPDGMIGLDDIFEDNPPAALDLQPEMSSAAAHVAFVTWDTNSSGLIAVARSHEEMLAGGRAVTHANWIGPQDSILATVFPSSFAGLSLTLMPWLICGGTLALHHGFDPDVWSRQMRDEQFSIAVLPGGGVISRLADADFFPPHVKTMLAVWSMPERLCVSPHWDRINIALVDILVFGETGFIAAQRQSGGKPAAISCSASIAAHEAAKSSPITERVRLDGGTLALRGPMVPSHAFPPSTEHCTEHRNDPHLKMTPEGFADTGYPCRIEPGTRAMVITGPPPGCVNIGSYRFYAREVNDLISNIDADSALMALPDALVGHRFAGHARNKQAMRKALELLGINPLIISAFRDQEKRPPAV